MFVKKQRLRLWKHRFPVFQGVSFRKRMLQHSEEYNLRVYWEDTDASGIVYHANYLRFMERARSELLLAHGFDQERLRAEEGLAMVIANIQIDYKRPAKLEDILTVRTELIELKRASLSCRQTVLRDATVLADATVRLAIVETATGRPVAMPDDLYQCFESCLRPENH